MKSWFFIGILALSAGWDAQALVLPDLCLNRSLDALMRVPRKASSHHGIETKTLLSRVYMDPLYSLTEADRRFAALHGLEPAIELARRIDGPRRKLAQVLLGLRAIREVGVYTRQVGLVRKILRDPEAALTETESRALAENRVPPDWLRSLARENGEVVDRLVGLARARPAVYLALASAVAGVEFLGEELVPPEEQEKASVIGEDEFEVIYSNFVRRDIGDMHPDVRIGDEVFRYSGSFTGFAPIKKVGMDDFDGSPHTIRVRFRASKAEVERLRDYLAGEVGKKYPYLVIPPLLATCANATSRALDQAAAPVYIPGGIDRSPTLTKAWFKAQNWTGTGGVTSVKLYAPDRAHKLRGFPTHLVDATLAMFLLPELWVLSQLHDVPQTFRMERDPGPPAR